MAKESKGSLKLLARPIKGVPIHAYDFVWATNEELPEYYKRGFIRFKKIRTPDEK